MKAFALRARVATAFLAALLAFAGILGSTASLAQSGRLLQLSTRAQVLTEDDVMIAGFIVGGTTPKTVVINVTGPSLAGLVAGPLRDPTLTLHRQSDRAVLKTNDNWTVQDDPADVLAIVASGFQPRDGLEPAIIATLPPGGYTAIVRGAGQSTGVAVVGVYEVDHPEVPLINISTRAKVLTGDDVLIAGFAVGPGEQAVLVNVAGPSLTGLVRNPLQNPTLTLVRMSDRTVVATNDDWQVQANPADVAVIQANGLEPHDPLEPAIIATLQPGLYTAIASGVGTGTGVAVLSVYQATRGVAISSANNTTFTAGTAGTFTVTTAGAPAATSVTATGALPSGVTFTPGTTTGTLAGTPAAGTGGTYNLTITASNGTPPDATQAFTLTVNQAPAITSANSATFQFGLPGTHTVVATGFPVPTLSVAGALPAGVTFDPATGVLAGTPTAGGSFPLTFTAANGVGTNATQNFTLTVNQTVAITSAAAATFTVGTAGSFTITTSAIPTATTITVPGLPPGLALSAVSPTGTATIAGTPTGPAGVFPLTITASNGGVTPDGTQAFTLTVLAQAQTISFTSVAPASPVANGPTYNVTATATSGLAVAFTIDASAAAVCSIAGSTVTFIAGGTCVINANQAGNGNFLAAPQVQQSMVVAKATQTVTITTVAPAGAVFGGPTYNVAATAAPSGLPVTFSTSTSAVCTAAGSTISFVGVGNCTVVATQAGNATYDPASASQTFVVGKASQTVSFTSVAPVPATVGATYGVTATATSGLPVAFTIDPAAAAVCSIAGSTVSFIGVGNCIINANQAGNANYNAAPQVQQSFQVRNSQAITFTSAPPTPAAVGGTYTVTATATSGLGVVFTSGSPGVCSNAGALFNFITVGTCIINANQPGDANYFPAPQVQQSFAVNQVPAITSANNATFYVGTLGTFTVTTTGFPTPAIGATGTLPGGVTFVDNGNGTATLSGTPAAGSAAGSPYALTITASNGVPPNATQPFTLTVIDAAVAVADAFSVVHDSGVNTVAAPGILANDLGTPAPTVFSVTGLTTCTVFPCTVATTNGSITVQTNGGGTYTPTAGFARLDSFTYIATNAGGNSAPATVTITVTNTLPVVDLDGALTGGINSAASFTEGGGPVAIVGTADPNWLTLADADHTTLASATIVLTNALDGPSEILAVTCPGLPVPPACSGAIQTTDIVATPAPGTYTITITRVAPLADYEALLRSLTYNNASVSPNVTQRDVTVTVNDGIGASNPVAHALVTIAGVNQPPTIAVPGAQTTPVNTARVFSTGNGNAITVADPDAASGDVQVTLTAANGVATLATVAGLTTVTGNGTATVVATGPLAAQNAALNGMSFTPTPAFVGAASLKVDINDLGNTGTGGPLSATQATINITVATAPTFTSAPAATFTVGVATPFSITTSASPPVTAIARTGVALPGGVTYTDNGNGTATLGGTANAGTAGDYSFTFTATNGTPPDGVQNFTLTVARQAQTISFTSVAPGAATVGGATYNVTATATSALAVTFAIDASASTVCTIAGSTVSFIGAGTCVVNANQAGDGTYAPAPQVQQTFAVGPGAQTISFTSVAPVGATFGGPTYNVTATATSGLAVTFTIDASAAGVCSIAGSTVSFIGAGTCVINANQAGNANYTAAPQVQQSFAVAKASQTISFTSVAPATATVGGATYGVTATATSGLAVTFTIDPAAAAVCSIAGSTVSFTGAGNCVINANQAGDANYNAAPQVQQTFAVKNAQTITFTSAAPTNATVGGATYNVTATATSALPVAFAIDASAAAVCTLAGAVVSFTAPGTCVINANQAGDASYYAAPQVQQSFVVKAAQAITFTSVAPTAAVYQGPTYSVTATGGGSGNAVTFTIDASASTVCSIAGAVVSFIGTGTCVVNANQLGNASFYDAPQVQQSFSVGPNLQGDAYGAVVGNTQLVVAGHSAPATPFTTSATGILANDTSNVAITLTTVTGVATTAGGLITINAAGAFTYTPPAGVTGADTYVYTGTSNGVSRTATITFTITDVVWYVDNAYGGTSDGRSHQPFKTLDAAAAPSGANSYIFVHTGAGTTTGNLAMDTGQELRGQGVGFTLGALTIGPGARPTLSGTVTLANDTLVTGLNFSGASPAINASGLNATLPILIDQVNVTGGTTALSLTNVTATGTGAITFSNSAISNTTAAEIFVSGGNIPLGFPANTTISGNSGRLIDIQGRSGGTVSFASTLGDSGTGILLNNNSATVFTFTGGVTLNGFGTTFTATNAALAGSLSITGLNTIGATTAPSSGTALNVGNINIAAGGLAFRSVSANGAASGIVLNNTGATAGLTVSGDGNATVGGNASGGTIQNTSSYGIQLTNTRNVSLTNVTIQNAARSGIDGQGVTNFTFANGTINNVGTGAVGQYEESNIAFNDGGAFLASSVDGTVSITNNVLNNARRHGIQIENGTGTISNLTITGNTLTSSAISTTSLGSAILVLAQGSAATTSHIATGSISNNTISNFPSGEGILVGGGSGNGTNNTSATLGANGTPIAIGSNTINGGAGKMGSNAIRASFNGQVGVANFAITNNNISNIQGQGVSGFFGGTVTGTTTITGNTIVANQTLGAGTQGLAVQVDDGPAFAGTSAADYNVTISNNNVSQYEGFGIRAIARASLGKLDVTITNNTVGTPILANRSGIRVDSGSAVGDVTLCLAMSGNVSSGSGVNQGMGIRKQGIVAATNEFGIVGLAPSPTTGANAAALVNTNNPAGNGTDVISGDNFVACTITP